MHNCIDYKILLNRWYGIFFKHLDALESREIVYWRKYKHVTNCQNLSQNNRRINFNTSTKGQIALSALWIQCRHRIWDCWIPHSKSLFMSEILFMESAYSHIQQLSDVQTHLALWTGSSDLYKKSWVMEKYVRLAETWAVWSTNLNMLVRDPALQGSGLLVCEVRSVCIGPHNCCIYLYPRPTKLEGGYTGFTLSVRPSVCL